MLKRSLLILCLGLAPLAQGGQASPAVADPALEARVLKLSEVLRCLVCQNQSIAESNAELAQDLRAQVREQLASGKSEGEVVDYMVARYGDFVLYQPPVKGITVLLWGGPAALLAAGLIGLGLRLRTRRRESAAALSLEEHARAQALLQGETPTALESEKHP
ncbi:MAG: cytochrome c-type biogenesis protein CcmH [Rhodocyclaceae bacterium]|nr:cytochrome c-type biogenesis protein CcmH [Rhodocyclaceae bacterium]